MTRTPGVRESPGPFGGGLVESSNSRIQIFDQDGKFLEEWKQFGRPSGLYIDRNDNLYSADHQSGDSDGKVNPGFKKGIRVGSAKDGKVVAFIPEIAPDANMPEGIAANSSGNHLWRLDRQDECASLGQSNHAIAHTGGLRCRYLHIARRPVKTNFCKVCRARAYARGG